jgi:F0F1-type ATP synthase membrane subunit a
MWFTMKDVEQILQNFQEIYKEQVLERVREVMRMQMRKYEYLFL